MSPNRHCHILLDGKLLKHPWGSGYTLVQQFLLSHKESVITVFTIRLILFGVCCTLAFFFVVLNYLYLYLSKTRHKFHSMIPFVGGIIGCFACVIAPFVGAWRFCWIPVIIDPSMWSLPWFVKEICRPKNNDAKSNGSSRPCRHDREVEA